MRSAIFSASPSSCVVSRTQTPFSFRPATTARTAMRPSGSTPAVGSSRKATSGRPMRARASERRCCSPPERWRHGVAATARKETRSSSSSVGSGIGVVGGEEVEDPAGPEHRVDAAALEHDADPAREGGVVGDRLQPEDAHVAGGGAPVALERLDRRGLARPVGAEDDEHLARLCAQVQIVHRGWCAGRAVAHGEAGDLDGWHGVAGYFDVE